MQETIFIGGGGEGYATPQSLKLKYSDRHRLIALATGTGKTVTLQIMAEEFSAAGVPVFLSDVKSDLPVWQNRAGQISNYMMHSHRGPQRLGFMIIPILISPWSCGICLGHRVILCAQRLRKWEPVAVLPVGINRGARGHFEHCLRYRR